MKDDSIDPVTEPRAADPAAPARTTAEGRRAFMDRIVEGLRRRGLVAADGSVLVRCLRSVPGRSLHVVRHGAEAIFVKEMNAYWGLNEVRIHAAAAAAVPDIVPALLADMPEIGGFAMARIPARTVTTWEDASPLAAGRDGAALAERLGDLLGRFHRATLGNEAVAQAAQASRPHIRRQSEIFSRRCATSWPEVGAVVHRTYAASLARATALAHGDFGPKNVLLSESRALLIDLEKAWFGDPSFDAGLMASWLVDRALRDDGAAIRPGLPGRLVRAVAAWRRHVDWEDERHAEARAVRLALARTLARHHTEARLGTAPRAAETTRIPPVCAHLLVQRARDAEAVASALEAAGIR